MSRSMMISQMLLLITVSSSRDWEANLKDKMWNAEEKAKILIIFMKEKVFQLQLLKILSEL